MSKRSLKDPEQRLGYLAILLFKHDFQGTSSSFITTRVFRAIVSLTAGNGKRCKVKDLKLKFLMLTDDRFAKSNEIAQDRVRDDAENAIEDAKSHFGV